MFISQKKHILEKYLQSWMRLKAIMETMLIMQWMTLIQNSSQLMCFVSPCQCILAPAANVHVSSTITNKHAKAKI